MLKQGKDVEWLRWWTEEYHSTKDDIGGMVDDLDEIGKLGHGFSSMDDLEEVDLGMESFPRPRT
jgi:ferritin